MRKWGVSVKMVVKKRCNQLHVISLRQIKAYEQNRYAFIVVLPLSGKMRNETVINTVFCYCSGKSYAGGEGLNMSKLWELYTQGKQNDNELSNSFRVSDSIIKRRISQE